MIKYWAGGAWAIAAMCDLLLSNWAGMANCPKKWGDIGKAVAQNLFVRDASAKFRLAGRPE